MVFIINSYEQKWDSTDKCNDIIVIKYDYGHDGGCIQGMC